jgi:UDP-N-acetylglucosamine--dolichyl-phosphate N-acetylglucosaminephosphotransferase
VLLGFIDDLVDLKWRYKFIVPTIATYPLLVAYNGLTSVIVPKFLRHIVGHSVDLGLLYRIYMGSLAVFCTNSINIYAGINGLEVGQSFIIGCFVLLHNIIEIHLAISEEIVQHHIFSLTLMIPFLFITLSLLKHNQFPSKVFVGDTFCYFAGMTFAVVAILGKNMVIVILTRPLFQDNAVAVYSLDFELSHIVAIAV